VDPITRREDIEAIVLRALAMTNQARTADRQLEVSPTAPIFGRRSTLDSLGLVALLIDIEDLLRDAGVDVTLSDERAVSQARSPFRNVPALVDYIQVISGTAVG
jgi:acyl carrier protein